MALKCLLAVLLGLATFGTAPASAQLHQTWQDVEWTTRAHTTASLPVAGQGSHLTKSSGITATWDADAVSTQRIVGDGAVEFSVPPFPLSRVAIGFNLVNSNRSWSDIDYCLIVRENQTAQVYEFGTPGAIISTAALSKTFTILRRGSGVEYLENGVIKAISQNPCHGILMVDTSFYYTQSKIEACRIQTGDLDGDGLPDNWELQYLPSDADYQTLANFSPSGDADSDGVSNYQEFLDGSNLSPATSKCTTCGHFKVHHPGNVW